MRPFSSEKPLTIPPRVTVVFEMDDRGASANLLRVEAICRRAEVFGVRTIRASFDGEGDGS